MNKYVENAEKLAELTMDMCPGTKFKECFPYEETEVVEENGNVYCVEVRVKLIS